MKFKIQLNAKCRNCKHWEFMNEDDNFLEDNETFCKLDNSLRDENQECEKLEINKLQLKDNLKSAGYKRVKFFV